MVMPVAILTARRGFMATMPMVAMTVIGAVAVMPVRARGGRSGTTLDLVGRLMVATTLSEGVGGDEREGGGCDRREYDIGFHGI